MGGPQKRRAVVQTGKADNPPSNPLAPCQKTFTKATSFKGMVALVRDAERRLMDGGVQAAADRVTMIRGLYYGTAWSTDYHEEQSEIRNLGFDVFAGVSPTDARPLLTCNLYQALQQSQDLKDGTRALDFGHLIIGLDARGSYRTRVLPLPMMGGTGLEVSTWLGDLGGGAAMLAYDRADNPHTRALTRFRGSDYGGSINIEGDVAGFLVGHPGGTAPTPPQMPNGSIAEALNAYVEGPIWQERAAKFMALYGGGGPAARASLISNFADKIQSFAVWYLLQRLTSKGKFAPAKVRVAAQHVVGASREVAQLFVEALEHSRTSGGAIVAPSPGPNPTPAGSSVRSLEVAAAAAELYE